MTDPSTFDEYLLIERDLEEAKQRIAELERWQTVDLENYKRHLAELTEQLRLANIDAFNAAAEVDDLTKMLRTKPSYLAELEEYDETALTDAVLLDRASILIEQGPIAVWKDEDEYTSGWRAAALKWIDDWRSIGGLLRHEEPSEYQ